MVYLMEDTGLKGGLIPIHGIMIDMDGAGQIRDRAPFDFGAWTASSVPGDWLYLPVA